MSLLMFHVDPDVGALILTDTLVTDVQGNPCLSTTKCRVFPHMRMAMAGTGSGNLLNAWTQFLHERMLAVDVDTCSDHSRLPLQQLWREICQEHEITPFVGDPNATGESVTGRTATIYHFGKSSEGNYAWYVFRSNSEFEPERWTDGGFGVKPHPRDGFPAGAQPPETLDAMIELGVRIRVEQDAIEPPERIAIGGELWLTTATDRGFSQNCLFRFDDWAIHREKMIARACLTKDGIDNGLPHHCFDHPPSY